MLLFFKTNKLNSLFLSLLMLITWFIYSLATNFEKINSYSFFSILSILAIGAVFHLNLDEFKNIEKQKNIFLFLFCFYQFNINLFDQDLSTLTSLAVFIMVLIGLKNSGTLSTHYAFICSFIIGFLTIHDPIAIIYLILIYSAYLIKAQFSCKIPYHHHHRLPHSYHIILPLAIYLQN